MDQERTPNCTEKEILHKAGLGLKKVKLIKTFSEEQVINLLESEEVYPKLRKSGGFELLRTQQNGRNLVPIPAPWTAKELRTNIGPQARIYIRPIQHSLSVEPIIQEDKGPSMEIACEKCTVHFPVQELRHHVLQCMVASELNAELNTELNTELNAELNTELNTELNAELNTELSDISSPLISDNNGQNSLESFFQHSFVNSHEVLPVVVEDTQIVLVVEDTQVEQVPIHESVPREQDLNDIVQECINFCREHDITNPVEILKKIQGDIVTGRPLELQDVDSSIEGDTTFITVDRSNILETSMDEISSISADDLRNTLEVQFFNEVLNKLYCISLCLSISPFFPLSPSLSPSLRLPPSLPFLSPFHPLSFPTSPPLSHCQHESMYLTLTMRETDLVGFPNPNSVAPDQPALYRCRLIRELHCPMNHR